jgi:hypothetical protein
MFDNETFQVIKGKISGKWKGKIVFISDVVKNDYYNFIEYIKLYIDWRHSLTADEAREWPEVTFSPRVGGYSDFFTSFKVSVLPGERFSFDPSILPASFWEPAPVAIENAPAPAQVKQPKRKKKDDTTGGALFD